MSDEITFYLEQNMFLGKKLSSLEIEFLEEKERIQRAIRINSYKIKILRLEKGEGEND